MFCVAWESRLDMVLLMETYLPVFKASQLFSLFVCCCFFSRVGVLDRFITLLRLLSCHCLFPHSLSLKHKWHHNWLQIISVFQNPLDLPASSYKQSWTKWPWYRCSFHLWCLMMCWSLNKHTRLKLHGRHQNFVMIWSAQNSQFWKRQK